MSGHSKWHQIKRKKGVADLKRAQEFTRLAAQIKQAAIQGTDPAANAALAEAIARAKRANLPQANIDRLLGSAAENRQEVMYEAFGPSGAALLIIASTDNNRRTVAEVRTVLQEHGGSLGTPGSVLWKFELKESGYITKYPREISADSGAELRRLVTTLTNHPDIGRVFTDVVT